MKIPEDARSRPRGRPRSWSPAPTANTIKSLDRAMMIFEHLSADPGRTLTALATDLGEAPATVYRVLVTLEGRGLVEFDRAEQAWHIGPRAFVIGTSFLRRTGLVERARPVLRRLMEETGETANLGVVQDRSVLFVSQVETHESIRAFFPPGTLSPLHASGIGKALLAQMTEKRVHAIVERKPVQFTEKTLTDVTRLLEDLQATRQRGHAIDDEERNIGMRCIAAPVFDAIGEAIAGVSVSGPTIRMGPERTPDFAIAVMRAASALTEAIGGKDPAARVT